MVPPRPGYKQVVVGVEIVESERVWDPESGAYVTRRAKAETNVSACLRLCAYVALDCAHCKGSSSKGNLPRGDIDSSPVMIFLSYFYNGY